MIFVSFPLASYSKFLVLSMKWSIGFLIGFRDAKPFMFNVFRSIGFLIGFLDAKPFLFNALTVHGTSNLYENFPPFLSCLRLFQYSIPHFNICWG